MNYNLTLFTLLNNINNIAIPYFNKCYDFEKSIGFLDTDKANKVARRLFPKDNFQYVMVGKADDISELKKSYGKVTKIDIKHVSF